MKTKHLDKLMKELNIKRIKAALTDIGTVQIGYFDRHEKDAIIDSYKALNKIVKENES